MTAAASLPPDEPVLHSPGVPVYYRRQPHRPQARRAQLLVLVLVLVSCPLPRYRPMPRRTGPSQRLQPRQPPLPGAAVAQKAPAAVPAVPAHSVAAEAAPHRPQIATR